ncbi:hypothetical protein EC957_010298 [Mortierella hygrophila]|uniref:Uncharacterized protein n=1 Tax=Mortierella hygrophila TaxID=979708 RepID=A0A9P6FAP2_9FUNG|nr:hypothetical protein EC957_010298 [Mortierella hygrophila]
MAGRKAGPRRFYICGIPVTYELLLRIAILIITIAVLVFAAIPKVTSILDQVNYVSVKITDKPQIPVPDIIICSEFLDTVELDIVTRTQYEDGRQAQDVKVPVNKEFYEVKNATEFNLQANGDWDRSNGKCVFLHRQPNFFYPKNLDGSNLPALVKIVFACTASAPYLGTAPAGLSMAIWNGDVNVTMIQPIWGAIPSINTLTFVYSEHQLLHGDSQPRYTLQKQNLRTMDIAAKQVFAKVEISPDSFYINQYNDNKGYSWVDLAGAIGGMASIALALWIFLFGSGRYKSWGVMQRYVLQTSPNSKRYRNDEVPPKNAFEAFQRWVKKRFSRLDSNADNDPDNMPLRPDPRRHSLRYSTALNTAAAVAGGGGKGGNGNNNNWTNPARSSMDLSGGNYYFTEQGAPGSHSLRPLAPLNENEEFSEEQEVEELIRLIDLRIDERMWMLEKTLSRYYLDGFRLRNYSSPYSLEAGVLAGVTTGEAGGRARSKEEEAKSESFSPGSTNRDSRMELLDGSGNYTPPLSSPPAPVYPPRPQVNQHYAYLSDTHQKQHQQQQHQPLASPTGPPPLAGGAPVPQINISGGPPSPAPRLTQSEIEHGAPAPAPTAGTSSAAAPTRYLPSASDGGAFMLDLPQRNNMRGTIRKAVERLQHEWPQSRAQDVYVPRTQYSGPGGNNNNADAPGGYGQYRNNQNQDQLNRQINQQYTPGSDWP